MRPPRDLSGMRFGRLIAFSFAGARRETRMSAEARAWFEQIAFGLQELFLRAQTPQEIDMAVGAIQEVWRLRAEAAA